MLSKIKKIVIFGGGTSGWLTAAYLSNNIQVPTKIVLVEDVAKGPIGVGEGTQPLTASFLYKCGLMPKDWMKPSNASFKYGVELIGWNEKPYFVDNDTSDNCFVAEDLYVTDYFINKPYEEFSKWHPSYQLAKENICQKFDDHLDVNIHMGPEHFGAVHFSALQIIESIKNKIIDRIEHVDANVVEIKTDMNGVSGLVDDKGNIYQGDLYIDCSGFASKIIGEKFNTPFQSYTKWLLNDSAVVMPTDYTDPEKECHPYTKATTMKSGWRFTIPIYTRVGNGYVYSSKHCTPEEAEKEFRESLNEFEKPVKHLKMKTGSHKQIAVKNAVAVGLSAGFVEPLEATGITFTTGVVQMIAQALNQSGNVWGESTRMGINGGWNLMTDEILAFVWAHYYFSSRDDTPYWKEIRSQKMEDLPQNVRMILEQFLPRPKRFLFLNPHSMFNIVQWFSMLHAGGAYKDVKSDLTPKQEKYIEYFIKQFEARNSLAKDMFKNQYQYLKEWYNE